MERIGVFCSSHERLDPCYIRAARQLGQEIGRRKLTLIYGGSRCGLMEETARAVKDSGGRVFGVVPSLVRQRDLESECIDIAFYTENLSDRKDTMLRESDILVALPGGVGTLDEIFSIVASATIGYHNKRTVLYNVNGFWDGLIRMLDKMKEQGLVSPTISRYLQVAPDAETLNSILFDS